LFPLPTYSEVSISHRYRMLDIISPTILVATGYGTVEVYLQHLLYMTSISIICICFPTLQLRFWMVTRGVVTPNGTIFKHHNPPNIGGLSTEGWDSLIYIGAFMVFSIDFWFSAAVQDFLQLVHQTGADIYQRWQDQVRKQTVRQSIDSYDSTKRTVRRQLYTISLLL
jgi:hypothetical protein